MCIRDRYTSVLKGKRKRELLQKINYRKRNTNTGRKIERKREGERKRGKARGRNRKADRGTRWK